MTGGNPAESVPVSCVAIAGCGKMGSAMVRAWANDPNIKWVYVLDPAPLPYDLAGNQKIKSFSDVNNFCADSSSWQMLVLAVKPQTMATLCPALFLAIPPLLPVISIAAGKRISFFHEQDGNKNGRTIIRAMPNLPGAIGRGVTVAHGGPTITVAQRAAVTGILSALGDVYWVDDETLMDAVTAISGSGPAYVFYLTESLADAAKILSIPEPLAQNLARQTIIGSAALLEGSKTISPAQLRENVTSPNGTTEAALSILMDGRWQEILIEAAKKAQDRSRKLSD